MSTKIEKRDLANFGSLELLAKQVVEGFITGLHKSPFHGFSVEFAEHRLYNKGESTKHLDWKLFARTEKLFTKKYEEETNLRCQLVIDSSSSMWFPLESELNKMKFSIYSAASLIELLRRQRDAVGLTTIADKITLHTPAKSSMAHHRYLYVELENLLRDYSDNKKEGTNFINQLHDVAELCPKRSLIVLFTDLLQGSNKVDDLFGALQHLRHNNHEVVLFHVHDKTIEMDFELENRPYTIIDLESGERIKIQSNELKEKYKVSVTAYFEEISLRAKQYAIDFISADINEGFDKVLMAYLIKRQRIG
jgi:uncharacterized protein (DUF58 family)